MDAAAPIERPPDLDPESVSAPSTPPPASDAAGRATDKPKRGDPLPPPPPEARDEYERRKASCPVACLGARDGVYYFQSPRGEFRALSFKDLRGGGLSSLFGGQMGWLYEHFPSPIIRAEFAEGTARAWLIRECERVFFRASAVRGAGVWPGPDGSLTLHVGDRRQLWGFDREGAWHASPWRPLADPDDPRAIHVMDEPHLAPADAPCSAADARRAVDTLSRWSYRTHHVMPPLILGWLAMATLQGAHLFGPHLVVTGDSEWGKSALLKAMKALLGDTALGVIKNPSEPFVRRALKWSARPVLIEESEASANPLSSEAVFDLLRLAGAGDDSGTGRGASDGVVIYPMRAMFALNAINVPPMTPQNLNRMALVQLLPPVEVVADAVVASWTEDLAKLAAGFRRRALEAVPRARTNLEVWRQAMTRHGYRAREINTFGQMLAWADAVLEDRALVEIDRAWLAALPEPRAETGREDTDPWQCWQHLASWPIERSYEVAVGAETRRQSERLPLGDCVAHAIRGRKGMTSSYHAALKAVGVKIVDDGGGVFSVVVANQHAALERIFAGKRAWASGGWRGSLLNLPLARTMKQPVRFTAGLQSKGVWIDAATVLPPVEVEPEPVDAAPEPANPFAGEDGRDVY